VLSLDTGHARDYSEGTAYRDYFSTDALMFEVPRLDSRLKNKAEVLTLLLREPGADSQGPRRALALSAEFLKRNPLHQVAFAGHDLVIVTSSAGANRVYQAPSGVRFRRRKTPDVLEDTDGREWRPGERALEGPEPHLAGARLPARRTFWFAWHAQFPDTELIR
jgi:hypothetical protein